MSKGAREGNFRGGKLQGRYPEEDTPLDFGIQMKNSEQVL